jgi:hypothetical protein
MRLLKRLIVLGLALACLLLLLTSCRRKADVIPREAPTALATESGGNSSSLIEKAPVDFAISFSFWFEPERACIYDTYNKTLQKDLVLDGTASADLAVTDETLNAIYQQIMELEVYEITEAMVSANLTTSDVMQSVSPNTEYKVTFTMNGTTYTVTGDASAWGYIDENASADHFCQFADFMRDLYWNTEAYKSLPEAEGGYD